jgi:hypothetical protein
MTANEKPNILVVDDEPQGPQLTADRGCPFYR